MDKKLYKLMNWPEIEAIEYSEECNPFKVLGPRIVGKSCLICAFFKSAIGVDVVTTVAKKETYYPMTVVDEDGFFAVLIPGKIPASYEYLVKYKDKELRLPDPYAFSGYGLKNEELTKLRTGTFYDAYRFLGAHEMTVNKVKGVRFVVWAPNALCVNLAGDFNHWDRAAHPMQKDEDSGLFSLFYPGAVCGQRYIFVLKTRDGRELVKQDPYSLGFDTDLSSSIITEPSAYEYCDDEYRKNRLKKQFTKQPISIYELSPVNFKKDDNGNSLNLRALAPLVLKHVKELGYTHVMLTPVQEYSSDESCGYCTYGFYSISRRFGSAEDFRFFVDTMHQNDIGVILEWCVNHFSDAEDGLKEFDGTCLYEHLDPRRGIHPFYGTPMFNYARPEVTSFLLANAFFLIDEFHLDGIRLNAVSNLLYLDYGRQNGEWIANIYGGNEDLEAIEFIKHLNSVLKKKYPDLLLIADDDSGYPNMTVGLSEGGLGFDFKLNRSMAGDVLSYIALDPYFRSGNHHLITDNMIYQYNESFINALDLELMFQDKDTLSKLLPGTEKEQFASLKLLISYMFMHPGCKLLSQGLDLGDAGRLDHINELSWANSRKSQNKGLRAFVKALNKLYSSAGALTDFDFSPEGFEWINSIDSGRNTLSFLRHSSKDEDTLLCIFNFSNIEQSLSVGTPLEGKYKLLINSDDKDYAGRDQNNPKPLMVSELGADGRAYSIAVKMAPLSFRLYKYIPYTDKERLQIQRKKEAALAKTKAAEYAKEYAKAVLECEEASRELEEAKLKLEEAKQRASKAKELEELEILKAKKALERL